MNKKFELIKNRQDEIFLGISNLLSGISSPVRLKLLHFLSQAPLTVEVLSNKIDQSVANTSMHLRKMLGENIVKVEVQGQRRVYSLHPAVLSFWESCQNLAQEIHPNLILKTEDIYGDINWSQDLKTTLKMAKSNEILLLDVRPIEEVISPIENVNYLHIPSSDLMNNLSLLPKRKPVLVFCRGRLCALSAQVVHQLREEGFKAYRMDESCFAIKSKLSK